MFAGGAVRLVERWKHVSCGFTSLPDDSVTARSVILTVLAGTRINRGRLIEFNAAVLAESGSSWDFTTELARQTAERGRQSNTS